MGYIENNLIPGEKLYVVGRLHWTIFSKSIFFICMATGLLLYALKSSMAGEANVALLVRNAGLLALVPSLWYFVQALIKRQATELAVTSKRVIAKFGFIKRSTIELNHSKVESFHVDQSVAGRIFGYGTLHINGTGGGITPIPDISDPLGFRLKAMEAIDASQQNS
ncbi:MAG: PH domain-containing protein [Chlorobium sp.]|nr:MAG: PH domain-containing protein [Chlorobium sp.]